MRTVRTPKIMSPANASRGPAAVKELSARPSTSVADPPSWTTRAKPKGIARVPTHAVRPAQERRSYARAKLSLPLLVRPNTRLPMGARDDRPDYDYEDGVTMREFEVEGA